MEIGETIYVTTREEFREWLEKNHKFKKEIWLVQYKKITGKPSIPYVDAVEEAICFGWIDGFEKGMDDQRYAKRFTPRRQKSLRTCDIDTVERHGQLQHLAPTRFGDQNVEQAQDLNHFVDGKRCSHQTVGTCKVECNFPRLKFLRAFVLQT